MTNIFKAYHLLLIFLLFSCTQTKDASFFTKEEKLRYEELFKDLLLEEGGIYTLFGAKPMTMGILKEDDRKNFIMSDYKKHTKYSLSESWRRWEKRVGKLALKRFLFAKKPIVGFKGLWDVFLIDVPATIRVLKEHYDLIQKDLGIDFDPESVVFEIQNTHSEFWEKLLQMESHFSRGLLLGFGVKNAAAFSAMELDEMAGELSDILIPYDKITLEEFNLPFFRSFENPDPILEQFKIEREKIKAFFRDKGLFEGAMEKLLEGE